MRAPHPLLAAACACALLLPMQFASAAGRSLASIYDLHLRISDLTPDDGLEAGYFDSYARPLLTADLYTPTIRDSVHLVPFQFRPANAELNYPVGSAQASIGPRFSDVSSYATGFALGEHGYAQARTQEEVVFLVQPYTALTLAARMSTLADPLGDPLQANAVVSLARLSFGDDAGTILDERSLESRLPANATGWDVKNADVELYYANDTDRQAWLHLNFDAQSQVLPAIPVPEPTAAAMLAAGMLLVGGLALRRRARGAG